MTPDPHRFEFSSSRSPVGGSQSGTSPETSLLPKIESSSGPQRTIKRGKEKRGHDPVELSKKEDTDEDECDDSWGATLVRFEDRLDKIIAYVSHPGMLSPETVLSADITKFVKGDLKQSVSCIFLLRCD